MIYVSHEDLISFSVDVLKNLGLSSDHAYIISEHLVLANLRGVDSHGIVRLPVYAQGIIKGEINPRPRISVAREGPSYILLDGDKGLGHIVVNEAVMRSLEKAKSSGVAMAATKNHWHAGMLAYYVLKLLERGCAGIAMVNASPRMSLPGFRGGIVGTNPLAIGVPTRRFPLIYDGATSVVAVGKILMAAKKGEPIPLGWAIDKDGRETTDPNKALEGYVLPIGGYKGLGIALMIDVLCGIMTGGRYGLQMAPGLYTQGGAVVIIIDISAFRPLEEFLNVMDEYIATLKKIPGDRELLLPGEIEYRTYIERLKTGIPLPPELYNDLKRLGEEFKVTPPKPKQSS